MLLAGVPLKLRSTGKKRGHGRLELGPCPSSPRPARCPPMTCMPHHAPSPLGGLSFYEVGPLMCRNGDYEAPFQCPVDFLGPLHVLDERYQYVQYRIPGFLDLPQVGQQRGAVTG